MLIIRFRLFNIAHFFLVLAVSVEPPPFMVQTGRTCLATGLDPAPSLIGMQRRFAAGKGLGPDLQARISLHVVATSLSDPQEWIPGVELSVWWDHFR
jgi:hypothetical protein